MGRGRSGESKALIERSREILEVIQPATLRAVCYVLFSEGLIPDMKAGYSKMSGLLARAREEGIVPWPWIVDDGRRPVDPGVFRSPSTFSEVVKSSFRLDPWGTQAVRVEVWSEKGTVSGTLAPVLDELAVRFRVNRGFASATVVNDIVDDSLADPRPLCAIYVGDFDPSGFYMSEVDLPGRIKDYGGKVSIIRVALVAADMKALRPLSFRVATKKSDPRHAWFVRTTKRKWACELDALSPVVLRARVEAAIRLHIDPEPWALVETGEAAVRQSLNAVMDGWTSIQHQDQE